MKGRALVLTTRFLTPLLVFGACLLFMWMFLATEGFFHSVEARYVEGAITIEQRAAALHFGATWRHGMQGGWPLYMPGFLVLSIAVTAWSSGRSGVRLLCEGGPLLLAAASAAAWLAPLGSQTLSDMFHSARDSPAVRGPFWFGWSGVLEGLFTLVCWAQFNLLFIRAVERHDWRLIAVAALPYILLHVLRQGAAAALFEEWSERIGSGDERALLTLAIILLLAVGVAWTARRRAGET